MTGLSRNGRGSHADERRLTEHDPYLLERGFGPEAIAFVGWRVERLGDRHARYGLPPEAADARVWLIPYQHANGRVAFERMRFIDQADLDRFRGGKYRQPARCPLALYDPFGLLSLQGPLDSVLLLEGEANTVAAHELELGLPVIGLPGQAALTPELAEQLGHIPVMFVWIDAGDQGAERNAQRITERLTDAGVGEIRFLAPKGDLDANETLLELGGEKARALVGQLLDQAAPLAGAGGTRGADPDWPAPLAPAAFHGLAGEIVDTILPHSEADPAALLVQFLAAFGNAAGRGPGFRAEADHHGVNLYALIVGTTAKGRKGTSWGHIERLLRQSDEDWSRERVQSGLSSGEGLIWAVRDPITKRRAVRDQKTKQITSYEEEQEDPGVDDKRLLAIESEFASVLRVAKRDGSTASVTIRQAWDRGDIQAMTKNSPARATGAHVSIIGHITSEELRRELDVTDAANGFANRFLFVCARRSKALPEGGSMPAGQLAELAERVRDSLRFAGVQEELRRDVAARSLWHEVYEELSDGKPGLLGAVTSRAEAQVMRLACVYTLLDLAGQIRREHLEAALAVWTYCAASARYIFGDATGDPLADEILEALRAAGRAGMTRTQLRDLFARHKNASHIERALTTLERMGLARRISAPTGGRPAERWTATRT